MEENIYLEYEKFINTEKDLHIQEKIFSSELDSCLQRLEEFNAEMEDLSKYGQMLTEVALIFKMMSDDQTEKAKKMIETVVNDALEQIDLKQDYELIIDDSPSDKQRELIFRLRDKKTGQVRSTRRQTGKGISQIISVLILLVVLKFSGKRRLLLLDEQLSGLQDVSTIHMFSEILCALAKNEDFQIFMVEHKAEISSVSEVTTYNVDLINYKDGLELVSVIGGSEE